MTDRDLVRLILDAGSMKEVEKRITLALDRAFQEHGGRKRIAKALGVNASTLWKRMKLYEKEKG